MRNDLSLFFTKYIFGSNVRSFKCDYVSNWVIMIVINIKKKKSWKRVRMWLMGRLNLTPGLRVLTWVGNGNKLLTYTSKVICTLHYEFMILWYIYGNVGDWNSNRKVVKYNGKSHFWYTLVSTFNHFLPTPCTACIKRVCNKLFSLPG